MNKQLKFFDIPEMKKKVVNVSSVPQRSPFRYPGGKTWLVPTFRKWASENNFKHLIEPFAGGGIISLTAVAEELVNKATMVERDEEIAAVWHSIMGEKNEWLAKKILNFDLNHENVNAVLERPNKKVEEVALGTILKNRVFHGGIITKGSGMLKHGENGKGIASRWYPKTLHDRIRAINEYKDKVTFIEGDAFEIIEKNKSKKDVAFFIDPPYTVAGKRLYTYYDIDHEKLFELASKIVGHYMLTYDDTDEVRKWAKKYGLKFKTIPMKTTHHREKNEIIICDNFDWWS